MSIYRSGEGHRQIRDWCEQRLAGWEQPHERAVFDTELGATHTVTCGTGPPVVLVPGTNFAATSWLELVSALSVRHTVHALDLPGQPGLSSPDRPRHGRQRYAQWLAGLLPRLSDVPVTLVGHSLGALVVLAAAGRSASATRMVLLDPAGLRRLSISPTVLRPAISWTRNPDQQSSAALLSMMSAPGTTPAADQVMWMTLVGRHVRTSLAPSPLPRADLDRLRGVPTTVVCGRHDAFLPADRLARTVHRRLPTATMRIIEGAGHLLPHERPAVVVEELTSASDEGHTAR